MIHLSQAALNEIQRLRKRHNAHQNGAKPRLHLNVAEGGCLTWHYVLSFVDAYQPDEVVISYPDLDIGFPAAYQSYFDGLAIDYAEDLMGGGFRFTNPNATQTCGCSHSFSVDVPV